MALDTLDTETTHTAQPIVGPEPDAATPVTPARSRRAILTAALGGLGGLLASRLALPDTAAAAAGDALLIGNTANTAGTANTTLTTASTGTALLVTQNGSGTALRGSAVGAGSIAGFFTAANGTGISGVTGNPNSYGVFGSNDDAAVGTGAAIRADGNANDGLVATTDNAGRVAVKASNSASGGIAVFGTAGTSGIGVHGISEGIGVRGVSNGNGVGVQGVSNSGVGVDGSSGTVSGVLGRGNPGVSGSSATDFGAGVEGIGQGPSGHGVVGTALADSSNAGGVYGAAVFAAAFAGYFEGKVHVTGVLSSPAAAGVRIDHPLKPADKMLLHFGVTSDEALTIYAGTVTTDAQGEATIKLPAWFDALNTDLRYQLTVIGSFAQAMVKREVKGNRFDIATSEPATKVSWQLTGVRQDAYAKAHPLAVEAVKTGKEKGKYLHPVEHGKPESDGVDYELRQAMRKTRVPAA